MGIKDLPQFPYAVKRMQIEPFVLDVPPEAFGEYVVKGASATVHAYGHPVLLQQPGERLRTCFLFTGRPSREISCAKRLLPWNGRFE